MPASSRTPVSAPRPPAEPTLDETRRSPWRLVGRVVIAVMLVGIAVMWGFAFFGKYDTPGRLDDQTFPTAAEPICKAAKSDLDTMQPAYLSANANERADVLVQSSDRLSRMLVELHAVVPTGGSEDGINQWIQDWEQYVRDRRAYADQLRLDPNARFSVTQSNRDSAQITKAVDNFAAVNTMPSCVTPNDLA